MKLMDLMWKIDKDNPIWIEKGTNHEYVYYGLAGELTLGTAMAYDVDGIFGKIADTDTSELTLGIRVKEAF